MKMPHLARVDEGPEAFAPLVAAAREAGLRIGWLDLASAPSSLPPRLAAAADAGVLRAVEVSPAGEGARVVSAKPVVGPPVLRDLVREHFLGCRLLLVAGSGEVLLPPALPSDLPHLAPSGDGWRLTLGDRAEDLPTDSLLERLRRPRLG
jgi:hypothetical protein